MQFPLFPLKMSFISIARSRETLKKQKVSSFDGKTNTSQVNPVIMAPFLRE